MGEAVRKEGEAVAQPKWLGIAQGHIETHRLSPSEGSRLSAARDYVEGLEPQNGAPRGIYEDAAMKLADYAKGGRDPAMLNDVDRARIAVRHADLQYAAGKVLQERRTGQRADAVALLGHEGHQANKALFKGLSDPDLISATSGRFEEIRDGSVRDAVIGTLRQAERRQDNGVDLDLHGRNGSGPKPGIFSQADALLGRSGLDPRSDFSLERMELTADRMEASRTGGSRLLPREWVSKGPADSMAMQPQRVGGYER